MNRNPFEDAGRAGVFHSAALNLDAISRAAAAAHMEVVETPVSPSGELEDLLRDLGRSLNFPTWYGANLDALHDCLTDPDLHPESGPVLVISGLQRLRAMDPEGFSSLTEVLVSATESRRHAGSPLWVLIDAPAPGIPSLANP